MSSKYEVCPVCDGEGKTVNPSIDGNGITASEMDEILHDDPDFTDDYMGGVYDVVCRCCNGQRVVLIEDHVMDKLREAADDRRLAAMENGDYEAYQYAGDYRYGY